ncbi:MAG: hypothetical protein VB131_04020 [Burkholderia gladioli]
MSNFGFNGFGGAGFNGLLGFPQTIQGGGPLTGVNAGMGSLMDYGTPPGGSGQAYPFTMPQGTDWAALAQHWMKAQHPQGDQNTPVMNAPSMLGGGGSIPVYGPSQGGSGSPLSGVMGALQMMRGGGLGNG